MYNNVKFDICSSHAWQVCLQDEDEMKYFCVLIIIQKQSDAQNQLAVPLAVIPTKADGLIAHVMQVFTV